MCRILESGVAVLWLAAIAHAEATLSLKAVARNGSLITPTNQLQVYPGDIIIAEVWLSDWSTPPFDGSIGLVRYFQARLLVVEGATSNGGDPLNNDRLVLPVGWDAPVFKDLCPCDDPLFPICDLGYGCIGPEHSPSQMANLIDANTCTTSSADTDGGSCMGDCCVDGLRSDYMFYGFDSLAAVDVSTLNTRFGGTTIDHTEGQWSTRCSGGANAGGGCTQASHCPGGACDANFKSYAGTINLKVGPQACGTFTFNFSNNVYQTYLGSVATLPIHTVPIIQPLVLIVAAPNDICPDESGACCDSAEGACTEDVHGNLCQGLGMQYGGHDSTCATIDPPCTSPFGACCNELTGICADDVLEDECTGRWGGANSTCATMNPPCSAPEPIIWMTPPNCSIDARIANVRHQPFNRLGYTSITLIFQRPLGSGENAPDDFALTQVPLATPPNPPVIHDVVVLSKNSLRLNFTETLQSTTPFPIQPRRWTCVTHIASLTMGCVGFLPADVDGNGMAMLVDIIKLVDDLNGHVHPPLPIHLCDLDRSGICNPADIITLVDLLNGNGFPRQLAESLPPCPSLPP